MTTLRVALCFVLGLVAGYTGASILGDRGVVFVLAAYLLYRLTRGNRRTTP